MTKTWEILLLPLRITPVSCDLSGLASEALEHACCELVPPVNILTVLMGLAEDNEEKRAFDDLIVRIGLLEGDIIKFF